MIEQPTEQSPLQPFGRKFKQQLAILGLFVGTFYLLELLDMFLFYGGLDLFGIAPRNLQSLTGVLWAPFLHDGFGHLFANTVPFIVLGWLTMMRDLREFVVVCVVVVLVSGLGTWLIGPSNSLHLGASGLIFGFFGYLVLRGYFERSWQSILIAVVALLLYGSMVFGVFPTNAGISWQMHLFGMIGGGLAAYWLARNGNNSAEIHERNLQDEIRIHS